MSVDDVEHTLFVCRQVNLYRVPPKATAGGHKSGEWKVADKIFTGRLKLTAKGEAAEVRLEDSETYVTYCAACSLTGLQPFELARFHVEETCLPCVQSLMDRETLLWSLLQTAPETLCYALSTLPQKGMRFWAWVSQSGMRRLTSMLRW